MAFCGPTAQQLKNLDRAFAETLLDGKTMASRAIALTIIYKGHRLSAVPIIVLNGARMLRLMRAKGMDVDHYMRMTAEDGRRAGDGLRRRDPFATLHTALAAMKAAWAGAGRVLYQGFGGEVTVNIYGEQAAHELREAWRCYMIRAARPRYDLDGIDQGIDAKTTRHLLITGAYDYEQRGLLRRILMGALWTPGRLHKAGQIPYDRAMCRTCGDVADTIGHRWSCPAYAHLRPRYLTPADLDTLPRCLTRCGVVPVKLDTWTKTSPKRLAKDVQHFLVMTALAANKAFGMQDVLKHAFARRRRAAAGTNDHEELEGEAMNDDFRENEAINEEYHEGDLLEGDLVPPAVIPDVAASALDAQ